MHYAPIACTTFSTHIKLIKFITNIEYTTYIPYMSYITDTTCSTYILSCTCMHACMQTCIHCLLTYLLTYLLIDFPTYLLTSFISYSLTFLLTHLLAYLPTSLLTYLLTYSLTCCLTYLRTNIHTYIHTYNYMPYMSYTGHTCQRYKHTYINTYVHTYIHTYILSYWLACLHTNEPKTYDNVTVEHSKHSKTLRYISLHSASFHCIPGQTCRHDASLDATYAWKKMAKWCCSPIVAGHCKTIDDGLNSSNTRGNLTVGITWHSHPKLVRSQPQQSFKAPPGFGVVAMFGIHCFDLLQFASPNRGEVPCSRHQIERWATWPGHRPRAPSDFWASPQFRQTWHGRPWGSARFACSAGAAPRVLAANAGTTADTHALVALVELDGGWTWNTIEYDGIRFHCFFRKKCNKGHVQTLKEQPGLQLVSLGLVR